MDSLENEQLSLLNIIYYQLYKITIGGSEHDNTICKQTSN